MVKSVLSCREQNEFLRAKSEVISRGLSLPHRLLHNIIFSVLKTSNSMSSRTDSCPKPLPHLLNTSGFICWEQWENMQNKCRKISGSCRPVWVGKILKDHLAPTIFPPLYYLKPFGMVRVKSKSPDPRGTG